jgi:ATP-dependent helicase/nuclease subunit A
MANRVFSELARWATLDDPALERAMKATGAADTGPKQRTRARRLFAAALDTPGGLKVQTIHAFCTRLLQQFPFEANVAARFRVLEDVQQRQLLEQVRLEVLLEASAQPESATGRALTQITAFAGDFAFQLALDEAVRRRAEITAWIDTSGGHGEAVAALSGALGVASDDSLAAVEAEFFASPHLPMSDWPALIAKLAAGTTTDAKAGKALTAIPDLAGDARRDTLTDIFLTQAGTPRARAASTRFEKANPGFYARLQAEQDRIVALTARRNAIVIRDRTAALMRVASEVIARYTREKDRRGLLDYEDLIDKTHEMLNRIVPGWVHYKLDRGIDHVLIDEAQDTSPKQWEIIRQIVAEFTAGAGARAVDRSIFVVGDDKQSIFSFQGAEPAEFDNNRRAFAQAHERASAPFEPVEFKFSFRSAPVVLQAVDDVFKHPRAHDGLTSEAIPTAHSAVRDKAPGLVELWDLFAPEPFDEPEPWDAPFDTRSETSSRVVLARQIAQSVKTWMARGDLVGDGDNRRPVRAGDILILVRQRGPLFGAIIRALKSRGVPVAGADRLVLTEYIAVMDLLTLADAILLPQDDLALATVLKSPLFGLSEEELFALAYDRRGPLRTVLRERRPDLSAEFDELAVAANQSPFAFFSQLLGARHGRRKFVSRLGLEANDALDEFLNLALAYEARETPSLQGFVAWMRTASADIKRDMEIARDEVRVMTVHGAKGLEAPVVVLADTTTLPAGPFIYHPRLFTLKATPRVPSMPAPMAWMPNKQDDTPPIADARAASVDAAEKEHRRLLYVAMTRAADRLVVCGAIGKVKKPENCWYDLVHDGLAASGQLVEEPADVGDMKVKRYRKSSLDQIESTAPGESLAEAAVPRPAWLRSPASGLRQRAAITPSSDDAPQRRWGSPADRAAALARGVHAHRLLQSLPAVPPARRKEAAKAYLARHAGKIAPADSDALPGLVTRVLDDPRFAALFGADSRPEIPVVGRITLRDGTSVPVSGQVDRLVVGSESILIADFKTNRPAPRHLKDVPRGYVRQLALYRALLTDMYPDRPVRAALVWTDVPDLMELSAEAMDAEIDALNSS